MSMLPQSAAAAEDDTGIPAHIEGFDLQVMQLARACADEIEKGFDALLDRGRLTPNQLFDTFYIPIPNTSPQKYHTQYDEITEDVIRPIIDSFVARDKRILFVVAVDVNGYLPTHNTRYNKPLTGNRDYDAKHNRSKRLFNDRTGIRAARNTHPYLLQHYNRDTGESMSDLSVPIFVGGRHWGAVRIGYTK